MANLVIAIALIITLIAGIAIGRAYSEFKNMRARIAALEEAQVRHLPYRSADEIEDATAALLAVKFQHDMRGEFIDNALAHLQLARNPKTEKEKK